MKRGRRSPSSLFPPTIDGFLAVGGGLRISPNSLKTWWPGTELNRRRQPCLPSRQLLFAPQDIAPSRKPVITSKQSSPFELTVKASPKVIQTFKTFNNKRNKSVYDVAGAVSDQELEAMVKLAEELKDKVLVWLRKLHPELLPP